MHRSETVALHPHPATHCPALAGIAVTVSRRPDGGLDLRYRLAGPPAALRLPAPQTPAPADNLWQHTCLETFIAGPGNRYREFNFSPSGQWAVYDFIAMRQRDDAYAPSTVPTITCATDAAGLTLHAHLPATLLPANGPLQLGLSAVIEAADGGLSYWALTHTEAKPDFHRREAFTLPFPCKLGNETPGLHG